MDVLIKKIQEGIFVIAGCIAAMLGGIDNMMELLFALMVIDVAAGVYLGASKSKFEIKKVFLGGMKKGFELAVIVLAVFADKAFGTEIWRQGALLYYTGYEGVSVLGNLSAMGIPFPDAMKLMFENMRDNK